MAGRIKRAIQRKGRQVNSDGLMSSCVAWGGEAAHCTRLACGGDARGVWHFRGFMRRVVRGAGVTQGAADMENAGTAGGR
ncbi:hypothetical protein JCM16814_16560 [Desulfobaculum senezii]